MSSDLVEMYVSGVRVAVPAGGGIEAGLVTLSEAASPHRELHIYVGQPEARAIQASLNSVVPDRPTPWDLLVSALSAFGARVMKAVITDVHEQRHFFAEIVMESDEGEQRTLACRPSDAIAAVLRTPGAALCAATEVMAAAGREVAPGGGRSQIL